MKVRYDCLSVYRSVYNYFLFTGRVGSGFFEKRNMLYLSNNLWIREDFDCLFSKAIHEDNFRFSFT